MDDCWEWLVAGLAIGAALGVLGTFAFAAAYRGRLARKIARGGRDVKPLNVVWGERSGGPTASGFGKDRPTLAGAQRVAEEGGGGGSCVILRYHPWASAYCCDAAGNCWYVPK